MNRQKMVVASTLFLALGIAWIISFWNGHVGFVASQPVTASKFSMDITVTGWPALGGFALTILGALLLLVSAVMSIVDLATARRA